MVENRKRVEVKHPEFDWGRVQGASLRAAAEYLRELADTLPADARIDEHWTGYEDMEMRVVSCRDETDDEYAARKQAEAEKAHRDEEQRKRYEARVRKRAEYYRLKRELGL